MVNSVGNLSILSIGVAFIEMNGADSADVSSLIILASHFEGSFHVITPKELLSFFK